MMTPCRWGERRWANARLAFALTLVFWPTHPAQATVPPVPPPYSQQKHLAVEAKRVKASDGSAKRATAIKAKAKPSWSWPFWNWWPPVEPAKPVKPGKICMAGHQHSANGCVPCTCHRENALHFNGCDPTAGQPLTCKPTEPSGKRCRPGYLGDNCDRRPCDRGDCASCFAEAGCRWVMGSCEEGPPGPADSEQGAQECVAELSIKSGPLANNNGLVTLYVTVTNDGWVKPKDCVVEVAGRSFGGTTQFPVPEDLANGESATYGINYPPGAPTQGKVELVVTCPRGGEKKLVVEPGAPTLTCDTLLSGVHPDGIPTTQPLWCKAEPSALTGKPIDKIMVDHPDFYYFKVSEAPEIVTKALYAKIGRNLLAPDDYLCFVAFGAFKTVHTYPNGLGELRKVNLQACDVDKACSSAVGQTIHVITGPINKKLQAMHLQQQNESCPVYNHVTQTRTDHTGPPPKGGYNPILDYPVDAKQNMKTWGETVVDLLGELVPVNHQTRKQNPDVKVGRRRSPAPAEEGKQFYSLSYSDTYRLSLGFSGTWKQALEVLKEGVEWESLLKAGLAGAGLSPPSKEEAKDSDMGSIAITGYYASRLQLSSSGEGRQKCQLFGKFTSVIPFPLAPVFDLVASGTANMGSVVKFSPQEKFVGLYPSALDTVRQLFLSMKAEAGLQFTWPRRLPIVRLFAWVGALFRFDLIFKPQRESEESVAMLPGLTDDLQLQSGAGSLGLEMGLRGEASIIVARLVVRSKIAIVGAFQAFSNQVIIAYLAMYDVSYKACFLLFCKSDTIYHGSRCAAEPQGEEGEALCRRILPFVLNPLDRNRRSVAQEAWGERTSKPSDRPETSISDAPWQKQAEPTTTTTASSPERRRRAEGAVGEDFRILARDVPNGTPVSVDGGTAVFEATRGHSFGLLAWKPNGETFGIFSDGQAFSYPTIVNGVLVYTACDADPDAQSPDEIIGTCTTMIRGNLGEEGYPVSSNPIAQQALPIAAACGRFVCVSYFQCPLNGVCPADELSGMDLIVQKVNPNAIGQGDHWRVGDAQTLLHSSTGAIRVFLQTQGYSLLLVAEEVVRLCSNHYKRTEWNCRVLPHLAKPSSLTVQELTKGEVLVCAEVSNEGKNRIDCLIIGGKGGDGPAWTLVEMGGALSSVRLAAAGGVLLLVQGQPQAGVPIRLIFYPFQGYEGTIPASDLPPVCHLAPNGEQISSLVSKVTGDSTITLTMTETEMISDPVGCNMAKKPEQQAGTFSHPVNCEPDDDGCLSMKIQQERTQPCSVSPGPSNVKQMDVSFGPKLQVSVGKCPDSLSGHFSHSTVCVSTLNAGGTPAHLRPPDGPSLTISTSSGHVMNEFSPALDLMPGRRSKTVVTITDRPIPNLGCLRATALGGHSVGFSVLKAQLNRLTVEGGEATLTVTVEGGVQGVMEVTLLGGSLKDMQLNNVLGMTAAGPDFTFDIRGPGVYQSTVRLYPGSEGQEAFLAKLWPKGECPFAYLDEPQATAIPHPDAAPIARDGGRADHSGSTENTVSFIPQDGELPCTVTNHGEGSGCPTTLTCDFKPLACPTGATCPTVHVSEDYGQVQPRGGQATVRISGRAFQTIPYSFTCEANPERLCEGFGPGHPNHFTGVLSVRCPEMGDPAGTAGPCLFDPELERMGLLKGLGREPESPPALAIAAAPSGGFAVALTEGTAAELECTYRVCPRAGGGRCVSLEAYGGYISQRAGADVPLPNGKGMCGDQRVTLTCVASRGSVRGNRAEFTLPAHRQAFSFESVNRIMEGEEFTLQATANCKVGPGGVIIQSPHFSNQLRGGPILRFGENEVGTKYAQVVYQNDGAVWTPTELQLEIAAPGSPRERVAVRIPGFTDRDTAVVILSNRFPVVATGAPSVVSLTLSSRPSRTVEVEIVADRDEGGALSIGNSRISFRPDNWDRPIEVTFGLRAPVGARDRVRVLLSTRSRDPGWDQLQDAIEVAVGAAG